MAYNIKWGIFLIGISHLIEATRPAQDIAASPLEPRHLLSVHIENIAYHVPIHSGA